MPEAPILVIDDDPDVLSTVVDILEFEGYPVERATNGAEGLKVLERTRPRLVLLDMRMPVLNGWDFARILKERGIQLPILVMTAAQDARRWAQEIGAQGYISKPFDLPDLLAAVERFRANHRNSNPPSPN
jgi:urea transport system substrate-binding protein